MSADDIWKDPEFLEWFKERPPEIQQLIVYRPPGKLWFMKDMDDGHIVKTHTYEIIAYTEQADGPPKLMLYTEGIPGAPLHISPPRRVFGVDPENIVEAI